MPASALALVLAAACLHATWNLASKRLGDRARGVATPADVVGMTSIVGTLAWAPLAFATLWRAGLPSPAALAFVALSAALHWGYYVVLQLGYAHGDLGVVYPLARGTGPLVAIAAAIALLGERPSALALAGALSITLGVLVIARFEALLRGGRLAGGAVWGVSTGVFVAAYTVADAYAVKRVGLHPILLDWGSNVLRALAFAPFLARRASTLSPFAKENARHLVTIGVLAPFSYILVLLAVAQAPVAYVAPAREISMLVAAWLGAKVLGEGDRGRRVLASTLILAGVLAIARG